MLISFHFGDSCGHFHSDHPSATCALSTCALAMCALTLGPDTG